MRDIEKKMGISKTKVFDILHEAESSDKHICLCHNLTSKSIYNWDNGKRVCRIIPCKKYPYEKGHRTNESTCNDIDSLTGWHSNYDKKNFSIVPFGVSSLDTQFINNVKNYVGWVNVTNDGLTNPWDSLPS